jgi:hypothetical protein
MHGLFKIRQKKGTVNSIEQKQTRVFCSIDVQEFHLWKRPRLFIVVLLSSNLPRLPSACTGRLYLLHKAKKD